MMKGKIIRYGSAVDVAGSGWVGVGVALVVGFTTCGADGAVGVGWGATAVAVGGCVTVGVGSLSGVLGKGARTIEYVYRIG